MNRLTIIGGFALIALAIVFVGYNPIEPALASVSRGGEYNATSTASSNIYGAFTDSRQIYNGPGTLGSVVITGAATGIMNFYDATTTDITKRTNNTSTSSILIASFPASTAAGTYTIDVDFFTALLLDSPTGTMPTTTITWREN